MSHRRRRIREKVLQALYAIELSGDSTDHVIDCIIADLEEKHRLVPICEVLSFSELSESREELSTCRLRSKLPNWEFNRLAVIDKIVLRLWESASFSILTISLRKVIVSTKQSKLPVNLAEKSDKLVNGVLDAVLDDLKANGRLNKHGGVFRMAHPTENQRLLPVRNVNEFPPESFFLTVWPACYSWTNYFVDPL